MRELLRSEKWMDQGDVTFVNRLRRIRSSGEQARRGGGVTLRTTSETGTGLEGAERRQRH